jgi:hypothetical protein
MLLSCQLDNVDYTTASATASINMTKVTLVTPTIICSNLTTSPMVHHWQSSVRYKYFSTWNLGIYSPLRIVLSAGTQISEAEFTPDDTANYSNVSMTVTINVLNPAQKSHQMITFVQDLVTSGELESGVSYPLTIEFELLRGV